MKFIKKSIVKNEDFLKIRKVVDKMFKKDSIKGNGELTL